MAFEITANVDVRLDESGIPRSLQHFGQAYSAASDNFNSHSAQSLALLYLNEKVTKSAYRLDDAMLERAGEQLCASRRPEATDGIQHLSDLTSEKNKLRFSAEKSMLETTTVFYAQTYFGLPVWNAGLSVVMVDQPPRITGSVSSIHYDFEVEKPPVDSSFAPDQLTRARLAKALGLKSRGRQPKIHRTRLVVYAYNPTQRTLEAIHSEGEPLCSLSPTLPLPAVPVNILAGKHYVATEVRFSLGPLEHGELNWHALLEVETGAVLYLRAEIASATGCVLLFDPVTLTGDSTLTPASAPTRLDPLRSSVPLSITTPREDRDGYRLAGEFVRLVDDSEPRSAPPVVVSPGNFNFSVSTNEFAAVCAYHHLDSLFRMIPDLLGINIREYFDGTRFPVPVDHRATIPDHGSDVVNAHTRGNEAGNGSGGFDFAVAQTGENTGIAVDKRIVIHEFVHAMLYDHIYSPNLPFVHNGGDSLAAILCDPGTKARNRFETYPWLSAGAPNQINRLHNRSVESGWAWRGREDHGQIGYNAEQILSTTLFLFYCMIGGDDDALQVKRFASEYTSYLFIRAIGSMRKETAPITPEAFAAVLMDADLHTSVFRDIPGGTVHKVLRWAFEKQGAYPPADMPRPILTEGSPPKVDVYIDDGRGGQYDNYKEFGRNYWSRSDVWVRHSPDVEVGHQEPVLGQRNFVYVRVKNRGTEPATAVVVKGYHSHVATGQVWPTDWRTLTTAEINVPVPIPSGGQSIVGPFEWTPQSGTESLMMTVSAEGDLCNTDLIGRAVPNARLVPFDNNIAQRTLVIAVPTRGGVTDASPFEPLRFLISNPLERAARVRMDAFLPNTLRERNWNLEFEGAGGNTFDLGPKAIHEVVAHLRPGQGRYSDATLGDGPTMSIDLHAVADDLPIGGLSWELPAKQLKGQRDAEPSLPVKANSRFLNFSVTGDNADFHNQPIVLSESGLSQMGIAVDQLKALGVTRVTLEIDLGKAT